MSPPCLGPADSRGRGFGCQRDGAADRRENVCLGVCHATDTQMYPWHTSPDVVPHLPTSCSDRRASSQPDGRRQDSGVFVRPATLPKYHSINYCRILSCFLL